MKNSLLKKKNLTVKIIAAILIEMNKLSVYYRQSFNGLTVYTYKGL